MILACSPWPQFKPLLLGPTSLQRPWGWQGAVSALVSCVEAWARILSYSGSLCLGDVPSVPEAMARRSKAGKVVFPGLEDKRYYNKKYQVFLKLVGHRKEYAAIMQGDWTELAWGSARKFCDIPSGTSVFLSYIQDPLHITLSFLYRLLMKMTDVCKR